MNNTFDLYKKEILNFDYSVLSDGLISGKLGLILYFTAVYNSRKDNIYIERAKELLEDVFENANSQHGDHIYLYSSLSKGLTGLVYVLQIMLQDGLLDKDTVDLIDELCDIILERSVKMFDEDNFTFLDGPIGNLFLFNFINDSYRANLLIDLLYAAGIDKQYPFYTKLNDSYTDGINLGMNYGYLSIINSLLPHLNKNKKADKIVKKCLDVIESHLDLSYMVKGIHIYKPHNLTYNNMELTPYQNNRLCWCNSDLSYAYILYKIAVLYPQLNTQNLADMVGEATIKRTEFENTGIQFAQLCHGTAGLSKLYSELATINPIYKNSSQYWSARTTEFLELDKYSPLDKNDFSLLFGKIGALMVMDESIASSKYLTFLL